ncbi:MAG TPA: hypothetical protein VFQ74_04555 [Pseudolysinimonas sp.]|nr:hypothetical protein [Pseudolysinimonas sp.]
MAEKTTQTTSDLSEAGATAAAAPATPVAPPARRTVTVPVLPAAIVGAVLVAVIFFGGGVAVGFAIGEHPARAGFIQPFDNGRMRPLDGQNGFGHNGGRPGGLGGGQNGGQDSRPAPSPTNG